jgi:hypothetical protein
MLSCYAATADERDLKLLEAVAPYVHEGYFTEGFFADLLRLADVSPDGVSRVLGKVIDGGVPAFDFEDRLKSLLLRLVDKGKRQDVILYADRLRMQDLFDSLTRGA